MRNAKEVRDRIREIDAEMASLFQKRMEAARDMAAYIKERGLRVEDCQDLELPAPGESPVTDEVIGQYYLSFLINIAMMYVNQGILYAKSKLSDAEFDNYQIYFGIWWSEEEIEEMGFSRVDVYFTRKAKEHAKLFNNSYCKSIDYKETKIYKYVKDVIGLSEFTCYHSKWIDEYEEVCENFYFVPKIYNI